MLIIICLPKRVCLNAFCYDNRRSASSLQNMSFKLADVTKIYDKDINVKGEDVRDIFQWVKTQPHLPEITELQTIIFLHSCNYSLEATKLAIDNYFSIISRCPMIFNCEPKDALQRAMSVLSTTVLPRQTPEGYIILSTKLTDTDPSKYDYICDVKLCIMATTLHIFKNGPADGFVLLANLKGSSLGHMTKVNLSVVKQIVYFVQEAAPVRIKGIHFVNMTAAGYALMTMIKPFLKKDLADMLHCYTKWTDNFFNFIPKECLPSDYGGELPSIDSLFEQTKRDIWENWDFFQWLTKQRADETKKQETTKVPNAACGPKGTFKMLEID